jgi:hypothetical protein
MVAVGNLQIGFNLILFSSHKHFQTYFKKKQELAIASAAGRTTNKA